MEFDQVSTAISVDGLCQNDPDPASPPTGFAKLTDTNASTFSLRGERPGSISFNGVSGQSSVRIWGDYNPTDQVGQFILDFPPASTIPFQAIARSFNQLVDDSQALRGHTLSATTQTVLWMNLGGSGAAGVTLFVRLRLRDAGSNTCSFTATRGVASVTLATFTVNAKYAEAYCVVPRALAAPDTEIKLINSSSSSIVYIADFGWVQGMSGDLPPVAIGTSGQPGYVAADPYLSGGVTFEVGEKILRRTSFPDGGSEGWVSTLAGTSNGNPLSGVTGTTTNNSTDVTGVTSVARIMIGTYLTISNFPNPSQVTKISGSAGERTR